LFRAVSTSTRRQLEARAPGKPIVVFPAWIDTEAFDNVRREVLLQDCWDLLFAGVLAPIKGIEVLLEAFARVADQCPQAQVTVVGRPVSPRYLGHLRRRAKDLGLADRVTFESEIPPLQLARLMGRARGLVLPSYSEGFPRVLIEAMLCGTPVLASQVGGIPEIIRHGEDGYLVPPGDPQRLAEAIARLYADTDIEAMSRRAKASARRLLSAEPFVDGHRKLFMQAHALWAAR
jgi:glycosyltransferase involved in cell wall biosynthesis